METDDAEWVPLSFTPGGAGTAAGEPGGEHGRDQPDQTGRAQDVRARAARQGRVQGRVQRRRAARLQPGHGALPFVRLGRGDEGLRRHRHGRPGLRHGALGPRHGDARQPFHLAGQSLADKVEADCRCPCRGPLGRPQEPAREGLRGSRGRVRARPREGRPSGAPARLRRGDGQARRPLPDRQGGVDPVRADHLGQLRSRRQDLRQPAQGRRRSSSPFSRPSPTIQASPTT